VIVPKDYLFQHCYTAGVQNAIRMRRSVQSQYITASQQRQTLRTTPPTGRGRWEIPSWTGTVQNQDKARSMDRMLVGHRPSGLPTIRTTMPPTTSLTSLYSNINPRYYTRCYFNVSSKAATWVSLIYRTSTTDFVLRFRISVPFKFGADMQARRQGGALGAYTPE